MKDYLRKCRICDKKATTSEELEYFIKDKASKHGRANCCIDCRREEYNKYDSDNREDRNEKALSLYHTSGWKYNMKKKYGITEEDYDKMYNEQKGSCRICGVHSSHLTERLSVDHCHTTKKVRGLLCRHCNLMLGNASDRIEILENGIKYLQEIKDK